MTSERTTDYTPGDAPLPVGTVVDYTGSQAHGRYRITSTSDPADHPYAKPPLDQAELKAAYPDGTAYDLWPLGLERKFGNRERAVLFVRRTSLTVVNVPDEPADPGAIVIYIAGPPSEHGLCIVTGPPTAAGYLLRRVGSPAEDHGPEANLAPVPREAFVVLPEPEVYQWAADWRERQYPEFHAARRPS